MTPSKGPPASQAQPKSRAMLGPGCATAGFFVWLASIGVGSALMTSGLLPEWGMFAVLGWPFLVAIPLVLTEAVLQRKADAGR